METLAGLAAALAEGRTSSRVLVEAALARIDDGAGEGARAFLKVDRDGALLAAGHVDALRRAGRAPSPFAGIPLSVKDLFDLAGEVTTAGSTVLREAEPASADAVAIARLKAAGLVVVGRTNMTEFAYSGIGLNPHYGTPKSVWQREVGRIPGGSSSGAAVSVADAMAALAIGTDTGGSCRIPAAFNRLVGYKPSAGRVPTAGCFPLSRTLDSIGPIGRSVACCASADALMAGDWDGVVATRDPASLRLAIPRHVVLDAMDGEVASAFDRAVKALGAAGAGIAEVGFPELAELPAINAKGGITAAEALADHRERIAAHGERYDPRVRRRMLSGDDITGAELVANHRRRAEMIAIADRLLAGFDGFLLPTVAIVPPPIAEADRDERYAPINFLCLRNTFIGNFLNGCAISLPMTGPDEAPAGLMLMMPWGRDRQLFAAAAAVEAVLKGRLT